MLNWIVEAGGNVVIMTKLPSFHSGGKVEDKRSKDEDKNPKVEDKSPKEKDKNINFGTFGKFF